ncbi:hypothetical protein [Sphingomonas sp. BK481]|uniref:hypothetical protein n=1 Tax=Sphingomonas sp. BK481 TaxID=2586981 RepID=UPI0016124797|nr:hypothetical protein [Sphingomonas sp. BK481]MBB3589371.1 hypothetical protein [Sphingomonas sp. BK481]
MAGLLTATSPSFIPKGESVSNLTNGYDFEAFGAGHPEAAQLRYIITGASIIQSPNLTEEGCLKTEALPVGQRPSSGYSKMLVVYHIKRPAFASRAAQLLVRLVENPVTHFRTPFLLVNMPPFDSSSIVMLIFH